MPAALSLCGVNKSFGGFKALENVDFDVRPGEVHALLGENGAGKSTLMNIACGLYAPDEGHIEMAGETVTISGARDAAVRGIGMVHQHFKLVPAFSVLENIALFNPDGSSAVVAAEAMKIAEKIGFEIDLSRRAGSLGISEQQRIEILKVLVAGARVIILDEPTAVLGEEDARALMSLVRALAESGSAVILVTHKLHEALTVADRITVMRRGRKIAETLPSDTDRDALTTLIVGEQIVEKPAPSEHVGATRIRLQGIARTGEAGRNGLIDVSFDVKDGEIYGIAGVSGNGQTELAEVLMGLSLPSAGMMYFEGVGDITRHGPADRRRHGLATIPIDRYGHGLAGGISVTDNFAVKGALARKFGSWAWFNRRQAVKETQEAIATYDVQGVRTPRQKAALLSGGNAQKLVIAREFQDQPSVILAHSPSRGLDVRASAAVHESLRVARDRGAAVILISEDLDEVLLLSDRIGVLTGGRLSAEFNAPVHRNDVGAAMVSHE